MSEFLSKSVDTYPYTYTNESYRGAVRVIVAGDGQTVTVFKHLNGVKIPIATGAATCVPPLTLDAGLGASSQFSVCVEGTNGTCAQVSVIDTNFTITPELDVASLADAISGPIVSAISGQTTEIEAALLAQTTSLTASLQAIVDTLDAGITVNAVQSGAWSVTIDGQPVEVALSDANISSLIAALEAADLTVTVGAQDVALDVNITNQPIAVTVDLSPVVDAIEAIVRVDYEKTRFCILDAAGDQVPMTGVYAQLSYNHSGIVIASEIVLSELVGSSWQTYVLQAGETVGECPVEQAEPVEKYAGKVCYKEIALVSGGAVIPLDQASGTLPDGTTYQLTGGTNVTNSTTTDGDTRWENNSLLQYTFSNPVEFTASPTNGGDVLNPIVWQDQASGSTRLTSPSGDPVVYTPGAFDALLDTTTNPNQAEATLPNASAPDAGDDWGSVVAPNTTQVFIQGRDAEAMNFSVRVVALQETGNVRGAYGCDTDTGLIYRDEVTNQVVDIDEQNITDCSSGDSGPSDVTIIANTSPKPDQTHVRVTGTEDDAIPAGLKTLTIHADDANVTIDGFPIEEGQSYFEGASELDRVRALLPAPTMTGAYFWIGLLPVTEV